jgi:hypothetical protein
MFKIPAFGGVELLKHISISSLYNNPSGYLKCIGNSIFVGVNISSTRNSPKKICIQKYNIDGNLINQTCYEGFMEGFAGVTLDRKLLIVGGLNACFCDGNMKLDKISLPMYISDLITDNLGNIWVYNSNSQSLNKYKPLSYINN